jgi:hypothetical protein
MLTDEQITELKAKHGSELAAVEGPTGTLVFKKPTRLVFDKWYDAQLDKSSRSAAARELAQNCLVFPEYALFIAALEAEPSLLGAEVLQACLLLSGNKEQHDVKKL